MVFEQRLPAASDLCAFFIEKARDKIEEEHTQRAGLLATQAIRAGQNRTVLDRVKQSGDIFMAWSNEPWVLDGAQIRISVVGFDDGTENDRYLDGKKVADIASDLSTGVSILGARTLPENAQISFKGDGKGGPFEVSGDIARQFLSLPLNPNGRPNSDVVRPWANGLDVSRRPRDMWIIDFGPTAALTDAAMYEAPFEYVEEHCKSARVAFNPGGKWWLHERPRVEMRKRLEGLDRYLVTVRVSRNLFFTWLNSSILPDSRLMVFARQDDYFYGVLHSRTHELWALRMASNHGAGNDPTYNNTTCFETFPLPWPPGQEPWRDERVHAIAQAARALDEARNAWLNPPDADDATLKKRTLTNLYNQRPTWLANLHAALDRAVWAAYGWDDPDPAEVPEDDILARLLALNLERAAPTATR